MSREDLNRKILEDTLAEKIAAYYTAEAAAVAAAQSRMERIWRDANFDTPTGGL